MTVIVVDIFPQFHYFPADRFGCDRHMAGRVQVDTDPAGLYEYGWMNFDHLPILFDKSTAVRNACEVKQVLVKASFPNDQ